MMVKRYMPRQEKQWKQGDDGSITAHLYFFNGIVEVFTFPGDDRHRPFTTLEMWLDPYVYHRTLDRHYHRRWIRRIAREFSASCQAYVGGDHDQNERIPG